MKNKTGSSHPFYAGTLKALRSVMEEDLTVPAMYHLNPCRQM